MLFIRFLLDSFDEWLPGEATLKRGQTPLQAVTKLYAFDAPCSGLVTPGLVGLRVVLGAFV
jgi:hypothetical protein